MDFKGIAAWALSGKTGSSSKFMASYLSGAGDIKYVSHPHDSGDFQRCVDLLDAVPSLREKLPLMSGASPYWEALISKWDAIENAEGPIRSKMISAALKPVEDQDINTVSLGQGVTMSFGNFKAK